MRTPPEHATRLIRSRYYLGNAFIVEHNPGTAQVSASGILLLPPLGYEDTCAYRPLRVLADALARAGHVVLRLDWPSLGDSAFEASRVDLVASGTSAIASAIASLHARGFARITGIGVRGGGLMALASPGFDELALWGVPLSGKAYLREERAFHQTAARAYGEVPKDIAPLPDGALEAGGFFYSPETVAALQGLSAKALVTAGKLRRALLIGRDGIAAPAELVDAFRKAGTAISISSANGLSALLENSYQSELRPGIFEAIQTWLATGSGRVDNRGPEGQGSLRLEAGVTERPVVLSGEAGELSGILCEPEGGAKPGAAWMLFLNAGGIRRSGPNRLWTRTARALAAEGRPSLRFDVRDVGDSDGATAAHPDLEEMYSESAIRDVVQAYDWALAQGAGEMDVVGLCSGSFLGIQLAARRQIRRAMLFNGLAFVWDDEARASGVTSHIGESLFDGRRWRRLLTGRINAAAVVNAIGAKAWMVAARPFRQRREVNAVQTLIHDVTARGTTLHLVSSEGDPSAAYLERNVDPEFRPRMTMLPGVDHTIRPLWAHDRVVALIMNGHDFLPTKGP
ncbi:MAG TPA: hypothetical protein VFF76_12140 [Holophagaceae bacterium]|jgi:alpha/beta superfamily hydrolase|nr:hypothetical protein [Holophagaceae bacterium]